MRLDSAHLDHARKVADAILYEGYLLYPYHQGSQKNRSRFQFGVLMPVAYAEVDPSEPSASQTQCLVECGDEAEVRVSLRFLQLQHRQVARIMPSGKFVDVESLDLDGTEVTTWDEAVEREEQISVRVGELLAANFCMPFSCGPATTSSELTDSIGRVAGTVTRALMAIYGVVTISAVMATNQSQVLNARPGAIWQPRTSRRPDCPALRDSCSRLPGGQDLPEQSGARSR